MRVERAPTLIAAVLLVRGLVHVSREPVAVRRRVREDTVFGSDVDPELAGADLAFQLFVIGEIAARAVPDPKDRLRAAGPRLVRSQRPDSQSALESALRKRAGT